MKIAERIHAKLDNRRWSKFDSLFIPAYNDYANSHSDPEEKYIENTDGSLLSVRQIADAMTKKTDLGRQQLAIYHDLATQTGTPPEEFIAWFSPARAIPIFDAKVPPQPVKLPERKLKALPAGAKLA